MPLKNIDWVFVGLGLLIMLLATILHRARLWWTNRCERCGAQLHHVRACEPYNDAHLICPKCDSTYNL